jgi:hypothetical protein
LRSISRRRGAHTTVGQYIENAGAFLRSVRKATQGLVPRAPHKVLLLGCQRSDKMILYRVVCRGFEIKATKVKDFIAIATLRF